MSTTTTPTAPVVQPMLVDDHAAAALLCLSVDTLRKDRRTTHLIPCVRIGRAVRYSPSRLAEFVARAGE